MPFYLTKQSKLSLCTHAVDSALLNDLRILLRDDRLDIAAAHAVEQQRRRVEGDQPDLAGQTFVQQGPVSALRRIEIDGENRVDAGMPGTLSAADGFVRGAFSCADPGRFARLPFPHPDLPR